MRFKIVNLTTDAVYWSDDFALAYELSFDENLDITDFKVISELESEG